MEVVPVIDLKGGVVVRARHGERASYRPIETPLSATCDPLDVVAGLLSLHPFRTLYIADLDAIERQGDAADAISRISRTFPQLSLWVDNGCADGGAADDFLKGASAVPPTSLATGEGDHAQHGGGGEHIRSVRHSPPPPPSAVPLPRFAGEEPVSGASLVLGSESQRDETLVAALQNDPRVILSLDFRGDAFLGPPALLDEPKFWPRRLIVMTLARVGSGAGPDFERYAGIRERAGGRAIYLAGGLRDRVDLASVKASGAAGILVASALHDGRITAADLASTA